MNKNHSFSASAITKSFFYRAMRSRAVRLIGKPFVLFEVARKAMIKAGKPTTVSGIASHTLEQAKTLIRMVGATITGKYKGLNKGNLIMITTAVLYFLSPLDLIPDAIPFIGFIDDIAIIGWVLNQLGEELDKFRTFEEGQGNNMDYFADDARNQMRKQKASSSSSGQSEQV